MSEELACPVVRNSSSTAAEVPSVVVFSMISGILGCELLLSHESTNRKVGKARKSVSVPKVLLQTNARTAEDIRTLPHTDTVFAQLLKLVPRQDFDKLAKTHHKGGQLRRMTRC